MPSPKFRSSLDAPDFDQAACFDQKATAPDYDEGGQGEFADGFVDPDSEEAPSQEWYARKQK